MAGEIRTGALTRMTIERTYFDPDVETISPIRLRALQSERLRAQVRRCYDRIPYYRNLFNRVGLKPSDIGGVDDLPRIPFTDKKDIQCEYPYGMLAVSFPEVLRFVASSGTTGLPLLFGYSRKDFFKTFKRQMGRQFTMFGLGPEDFVYQAHGYGLFTGGMGVEAGVEAIGGTLFPAGPGRTAAAVAWLRDLGHTAIFCTPSFIHHLVNCALAEGIDPQRQWKLRRGGFGGEPAAPALRKKIVERLPQGFRYNELYGSAEMGGPTVAGSCSWSAEVAELHVMADHYLLEVVDPQSGEPVEPGHLGELVFTTLTREAMPLLRWRTRDISGLAKEPYNCPCGRAAHPRIFRITGRSDDMLKVRGTAVFPSQVEEILNSLSGIGGGWQIVLDRPREALDRLQIQCEAREDLWGREELLRGLAGKIRKEVEGRLGLSPEVEIRPPGSLPRYEGKAIRVIDQR